MQNEELLHELSRRVASGELDSRLVLQHLGLAAEPATGATSAPMKEVHARFSVTQILYILGTAVLALGIMFLVAQIWEDIGIVGRITVTLILGLAFAAAGSYLLRAKAESHLGSILHIVGGLLIPGGAMVALNELGDFDSLWARALAIGVVFAFYLLLNAFHKNQVLTLFSIGNGTAFVYLLAGALMDGMSYLGAGAFYAYITMAIGVSYLLLTRSFVDGWNRNLVGVLNFFGSLAILGGAFSRVFDYGLWQLLFFVLAAGGLALAIQIRSKSMLAVSTIFLIIHFIYITNEYFADSIGWPISLVLLGCLIIGLGYLSITLNKKYIDGSGTGGR